MKANIMRPAIQLHSVRNHDASLPDVIRRVNDAGFEGVEFAGRLEHADPDAVAETLDETGLVPLAGHVDLARLESELDSVVDTFERIDCSRVVIPHLPDLHFRTRKRIRTLATRLEETAAELDDRGFQLAYHNTRHDLFPPFTGSLVARLIDDGFVPGAVEGLALERLRIRRSAEQMEYTGIGQLFKDTADSNIDFEIDAGEARAANLDQGTVYDFFGDRLMAVHVCDVTDASDGYQSTSPGTGVLDYDEVFSAAERTGVEWLIYEHDHPTDPERTIHRGANAVREPIRERRETVPT